MAKEVAAFIKLQIKGGAANPSPPVGPALEYISYYIIVSPVFLKQRGRCGNPFPS